jgi:hypothetical protein
VGNINSVKYKLGIGIDAGPKVGPVSIAIPGYVRKINLIDWLVVVHMHIIIILYRDEISKSCLFNKTCVTLVFQVVLNILIIITNASLIF